MTKTAVITGGSSGIGKRTAEKFASNGYKVYELSRSGKSTAGITHIYCDVSSEQSVKEAFAEISKAQNHIDVMINNAGMGISGTIEFTEEESARKIFDVNFFGTFHCVKEALPLLRNSDDAVIINLSSVAAVLSIPYQSFYSATKAAVNSLTLALKNELKQFGIKVSAVMPGDVSTGFTDSRKKNDKGAEIYGSVAANAVSVMEKDERGGMKPEYIAALIYKVSQKNSPKVLYTGGVKYKLFVFISKVLPVNFVNMLVGKIYG